MFGTGGEVSEFQWPTPDAQATRLSFHPYEEGRPRAIITGRAVRDAARRLVRVERSSGRRQVVRWSTSVPMFHFVYMGEPERFLPELRPGDIQGERVAVLCCWIRIDYGDPPG